VTPLTSSKFAELVVRAGFPPGVVNILPGSGMLTLSLAILDPRIGCVLAVAFHRSLSAVPRSTCSNVIMAALCNRGAIIFLCCGLFFPSFFFFLFFSSPNLSGRRLDVYHTLAHGVALVQI